MTPVTEQGERTHIKGLMIFFVCSVDMYFTKNLLTNAH